MAGLGLAELGGGRSSVPRAPAVLNSEVLSRPGRSRWHRSTELCGAGSGQVWGDSLALGRPATSPFPFPLALLSSAESSQHITSPLLADLAMQDAQVHSVDPRSARTIVLSERSCQSVGQVDSVAVLPAWAAGTASAHVRSIARCAQSAETPSGNS